MLRALQCLAVAFVAATGLALAGPTPTPAPAPSLNAQQFNQHLKDSLEHHVLPTPYVPTVPLHVVLVVETNKKGQVARVRKDGSHGSNNDAFNAMCYGNALQAWIRTEDGRSIPGTYRLTYDYSPDTQKVKRSVELIKAGGVNPDAIGAVDDMQHKNQIWAEHDKKVWEEYVARQKAKAAHASPKPSATPTHHA